MQAHEQTAISRALHSLKDFEQLFDNTLHKKRSCSLRISSVNVSNLFFKPEN